MALSDDDFHDLQVAATLARECAETEGWGVITDRIKAQVARRQEAMIAGRVPDWETYRTFADWLDCALWVLQLPDQIEGDVEEHRKLRIELEPVQ